MASRCGASLISRCDRFGGTPLRARDDRERPRRSNRYDDRDVPALADIKAKAEILAANVGTILP
jgi:hypothetical protein